MMYFVVEVRKSAQVFEVDPQRIFRTQEEAYKHCYVQEDTREIVVMMNAAQLLLALVQRGIDIDTAHGIVNSV